MTSAGSESVERKMIPPMDETVPAVTETATFALGCFWGPDSRFGAVSGVVRTCVGYTGGEKPHPTYHDLGDHSESVQMDFDPTVITYRDLLDIFWESHNPAREGFSRQYMAAVFYHDEEQKKAIDTSRDRIASTVKGEIKTKVLPFTGFFIAEDYHQKHALGRYPELLKEFRSMYPTIEGLISSAAAARANGYLAGYGGCNRLTREIDEIGLSPEGSKRLVDIVCGRKASISCKI